MITLTLALLAMAPATTNENFSGYFPTLCRAITSETWDQTGNLLFLSNTASLASTILYHKSRICQYMFAGNSFSLPRAVKICSTSLGLLPLHFVKDRNSTEEDP